MAAAAAADLVVEVVGAAAAVAVVQVQLEDLVSDLDFAAVDYTSLNRYYSKNPSRNSMD